MAGTKVTLDARNLEVLQRSIAMYGEGAGHVIDEVLHNDGGKLITEEIMRLLPESGRTWKDKKTAAKHAKPFTQGNGNMSVVIKTRPAYGYLYFPDEGTNTKRHVGYKGKPREFMLHGAVNQRAKIINLCVERLIKKWESD